jgi:hypothetical protein
MTNQQLAERRAALIRRNGSDARAITGRRRDEESTPLGRRGISVLEEGITHRDQARPIRAIGTGSPGTLRFLVL